MAITDHGVLQAFRLRIIVLRWMNRLRSFTEWKVIFVNDLKKLVTNDKGQTLLDDYVVFDLETTGLVRFMMRLSKLVPLSKQGENK